MPNEKSAAPNPYLQSYSAYTAYSDIGSSSSDLDFDSSASRHHHHQTPSHRDDVKPRVTHLVEQRGEYRHAASFGKASKGVGDAPRRLPLTPASSEPPSAASSTESSRTRPAQNASGTSERAVKVEEDVDSAGAFLGDAGDGTVEDEDQLHEPSEARHPTDSAGSPEVTSRARSTRGQRPQRYRPDGTTPDPTPATSSAPASASTSLLSTSPRNAKSQQSNKRKRPAPRTPQSACTPSHPSFPATLIPHGLHPIPTNVNAFYLYLFFRFCSERQTMQDKREAGVPRDQLSDDETMRKSFVGNVYRELDKGSIRVRGEIIGKGDQSVEEVCFRLFLFCGFHEYNTYTTLVDALGYPPRWSTFVADLPIYEKALHKRSFHERKTIYTSGFQLVPPTKLYGVNSLPHYAATLRFVKSLMDSGLPRRLHTARYAVDASHMLQSFPTLGPFLSLGILCYLNDLAGFKFFWRDFASCGPGARGFLRRIFGGVINSVAAEEAGLRWLRENQWVIFKRLGVDPPFPGSAITGARPGMRCLDIENSLCWCHRYVNDYTKNNWASLADIPLPDPYAFTEAVRPYEDEDAANDNEVDVEASEPAWCETEEHVSGINKAVVKGDYDELKERLPPTEAGEEVYEVERIVCRKGSRGDKDGLFRVRWKGYRPEEDTWERASSLKDGAAEALQEWLDWEETVEKSIRTVKEELPWSRPSGIGGRSAGDERDQADEGERVREEQREQEDFELEEESEVDAESERKRAKGVGVDRSGRGSATREVVAGRGRGRTAPESVLSEASRPFSADAVSLGNVEAAMGALDRGDRIGSLASEIKVDAA